MLLHGNNLKINDPYNRIHDNLIYPVKSDAISTPRDHLPPDPTLPKPRVVLYHSTPPPPAPHSKEEQNGIRIDVTQVNLIRCRKQQTYLYVPHSRRAG